MATRPRRRRARGVVIGLLTVLGVLLSVAVGGGLYLERRLAAPIDRIPDVFAGLPDRPPKPATGPGADAVNILLLGTDRRSTTQTTGSRASEPGWMPGEQRSDAMLLLHVSADRAEVAVISLPRDSWVEVPGHGSAKINAAYSYGGPRLAVATVEALTRVRVDHLAVVDWEGLARLTDALGGVTVEIPATVHDSARGVTWSAGPHELDGEASLLYLRQRYGLPGGDLDRARRHQNFLRALLSDTLERIANGGPLEVIDLLGVVAENLSVDAEWSTAEMARLAWSLRGLDPSGVVFLTAPVAGLGWEGTQSVVHLDDGLGAALWAAVREDRVGSWVEDHPTAVLPAQVR